MSEPSNPPSHETQEPNADFGRDLGALFGSPAAVPEKVELAIRESAAEHLDGIRVDRKHGRRWALAVAAAILVILLPLSATWLERGAEPPQAFAREDLDRDGRVDVLDPFFLARQLRDGPVDNLDWDFDGDGRVDQRDVDWLGQFAVRWEADS
ncbi:MAG: dockerin type I domain-containing protein [Planctomycetota bacterium]